MQLGFDTLLRGLRADVRPRLRRVVLQAISTIIDNDPSLAATLLGIDPENPPTEPPPPPDVINNSNHDIRWKTTTAAAAAAASGASDSSSTAQGVGRRVSPAAAASGGVDNGLGSRVRRQLRKRAAAVRIGNEIVSDAVDGSGDDVGPTKDLLLDRITDILGLHPVGTGFGVGGEEGKSARAGTEASAATAGADVGGGGPARRALRAVVDLLPRPAVRPSSLPSAVVSASVRTPAAFVRAAAAASAATGRAIAAAGGGQDGNSDSAGGDEEDGRNWWKDEVRFIG